MTALLIVIGVFITASLCLVFASALRLGMPITHGMFWRFDLRGWPRRWAGLLALMVIVKGLEWWERSYKGLPLWPHWKLEAVLILIFTGLLTLFTSGRPHKKQENSQEEGTR